jgi:DNA-binding response OmpR family regulator
MIVAVVPKVLIIEDDDVIARGMASHLNAAGFDPLWVNKGEAGLARLRYEKPDVCVLDLMLPGVDGWRVIETARAEGIGTPIVVVSARGTEHDRVHALEIGADDYLVKPFSMKELVAARAARRARGVRVQDETAATRSSRGAPDRPAQRAGLRRRRRAPS